MARTHFVKKANKQWTCRTCRQPIEIGKPYKWFKMRYYPKFSYHDTCTIPKAHMTTSEHLGNLYGAQDDLTASVNSFRGFAETDFAGAVTDLISAVEEAEEMAEQEYESYTESADNQEEYFPGSYQIDEIREKADACEEWRTELEQARDVAEAKANEFISPDDDGEDYWDEDMILESIEEAAIAVDSACDALTL